ncbi:class I SAM-dependent methyltransferase [Chitiniphilus purpureus]|uniref:Class I SAM-dependent methyltransferase n=1 Tax=Chitiniphilus purpureus TaxID=2981137 RepID=A0ABY6DMH0_9NEIS|nr:class I SAM-dependent methyltransferase [Chitiniphilus sp. CD1]UXY15562.1 class I SAM-dependent methyltransferase [Chitiniphilus sp. CD1]
MPAAAPAAMSDALLLPLAARAGAARWCPGLGFRDPAAERLAARFPAELARLRADPALLRGCCVRAQWLDRQAADFAAQHRRVLVLNLGAGLDTAYQRLSRVLPDDHLWIDVDLPPVVALKRALAGESARQRLLAADLARPHWFGQLPDPAGRAVVLRAEGVLMALDPTAVAALLHRLARHFEPAAAVLLLFDWVSPWMAYRGRRPSCGCRCPPQAPPLRWALEDADAPSRCHPGWYLRAEFDAMPACGAKAALHGMAHRWLTGRPLCGCSAYTLAVRPRPGSPASLQTSAAPPVRPAPWAGAPARR